jgi:DegV family protein with EDD domain
MDIGVVTDSTADLPSDLAQALQVQVVPAILIIDGKSLKDGEGISRQEFYEQMPGMKTPPTTSAPSSGAFAQIYQQLFLSGVSQIISIHVASTLSGIYNAARVAAREFGRRVHVVDSGQVTLGLGYQVLAAAEAALNGLPFAEILGRIADVRRRVRLIAMLDTLEYVRRSGRVSWARASLGTLLQIKPFLSVEEGKVLRLGEARTRHKGMERLYTMLRELGALERLAILHTNAEADALQMLAEFVQSQTERPLLVNVTTVIGTHVGPNALGFVGVIK